VLTDASGAFADLPGYLRWHVAPDRRAGDEARIVAEVGAWIGSQVLGPVAGALARKRPAYSPLPFRGEAADDDVSCEQARMLCATGGPGYGGSAWVAR